MGRDFIITNTMLSSPVKVVVSIRSNFQIFMDLTWLGETYNFIINQFIGSSGHRPCRKFLNHGSRDSITYGQIDPQTDGLLVSTDQKKAIMKQVCQDVVIAIKTIVERYKSSVIDYAVWYTTKRPPRTNYSMYTEYTELITELASNYIIHTGLSANVKWEIIEYPPPIVKSVCV